jgi:hypothetical protein
MNMKGFIFNNFPSTRSETILDSEGGRPANGKWRWATPGEAAPDRGSIHGSNVD